MAAVAAAVVVATGSAQTRPADAPASVTAAVVRVACVGDSITFGLGLADRDTQSYPARLGVLLGDGFVVKNFGINGTTALRDGDRPWVNRPAAAAAYAFKPDVVFIGLGTNDSKPQNWMRSEPFVADYEWLIAAFRNVNPAVKVYVLLPAPSFLRSEADIRDRVMKDEIVPRLRTIAADCGCRTIDLRSALDGRRELFPDTVHPNADGARLIAETVAKALRE